VTRATSNSAAPTFSKISIGTGVIESFVDAPGTDPAMTPRRKQFKAGVMAIYDLLYESNGQILEYETTPQQLASNALEFVAAVPVGPV
jgi:hypothetical protein